MSDWKKQLEDKVKELNIKEEINGQSSNRSVCTNSDNSSRSINSISNDKDTPSSSDIVSSRSRSVFRSKVSTKISEKGGEIKMIPSKGIFDDYNAIDKEQIPVADKVWKFIPKLIKVILNCRTNTVKIMDKLGIPRDDIKKEGEVK